MHRYASLRRRQGPFVTFHMPSRGLIGYHGEFLTDTRGYRGDEPDVPGLCPWAQGQRGRVARNGVLISTEQRRSGDHYGLWYYLQERGKLFIDHRRQGVRRHDHRPEQPRTIRPGRSIRSSPSSSPTFAPPPRTRRCKLIPPIVPMTLEQAMAYIEDDELVEVTPSAVRIRKRYLDPNERKRNERKSENSAA